MSDRRRTPANGRVALSSLQGQVDAERFVGGTPKRVISPVVDICAAPSGPRDRQALYGAEILMIEESDGWAFVQARADGYVGYVQAEALGDPVEVNQVVSALATHAYSKPDLKSPEILSLSHSSRLRIVGAEGDFFETAEGWFVPRQHLRAFNAPLRDPATVAQQFFGVPYLWGGNSSWGIDCSGLVQVACLACGITCPGDSDMQADELGEELPAGTPLQRGDVVFWKGHVAMMVDDEVLIHANAHTMSVAYEPLDAAIFRIGAAGDGPVTKMRRITRPT